MTHNLAVALLGAALRELLPLLHRIADAMDPCGSAPGWTPVPPTVPTAWVEMEAGR